MMLEYVDCNICKSDDTVLVYKANDPTNIVLPNFNIVKCKSCGLVYLNPRPPQNEIHKYYPKFYYAYTSSKEEKYKLRKIIRVCVIRGRSAGAGIFNKLLFHCLKNKVKYLLVKPVGRFLDVGCGIGSLVKSMQEIGWESRGVEISSNAIKIAKNGGLNVYLGDLIQQGFPSNFFDLINMDNVLEHVHNPLQVLTEVSRILKNNGRFYCSVPNFDSFQNRNFGKYWRALDVPRHLYFFTPNTLSILFEKSSLRIIKMRSSIRKGNERLPSTRVMLHDLNKYTSYFDVAVKNLKELLLKPFLYAVSSRSVKIHLGQQLIVEASRNYAQNKYVSEA